MACKRGRSSHFDPPERRFRPAGPLPVGDIRSGNATISFPPPSPPLCRGLDDDGLRILAQDFDPRGHFNFGHTAGAQGVKAHPVGTGMAGKSTAGGENVHSWTEVEGTPKTGAATAIRPEYMHVPFVMVVVNKPGIRRAPGARSGTSRSVFTPLLALE